MAEIMKTNIIYNLYSMYHAQGVYESQCGTGSPKRVFKLTRSGFPGQQRYGTFVWAGDNARFTLYNDAGDGYGYEQGDMGMLSLIWDDDNAVLTQISSGEISYIPQNIEVNVIRQAMDR